MNFSTALPTFVITLREGVEAALVLHPESLSGIEMNKSKLTAVSFFIQSKL